MRQPDSQTTRIREHLEAGERLTPIQALLKFNCFRLAARIDNLRSDGVLVKTEMIEKRGKRFARYSI